MEKFNKAMEKIKQYVKEHEAELIVFGSGMFVGIFTTRYIYERNLNRSASRINQDLMDNFIVHHGNFQRPDGTFPVPQLVKM